MQTQNQHTVPFQFQDSIVITTEQNQYTTLLTIRVEAKSKQLYAKLRIKHTVPYQFQDLIATTMQQTPYTRLLTSRANVP